MASAQGPNSAPLPRRRRRGRGRDDGASIHYVSRPRLWANVALVGVTLLTLAAALGPWWQITLVAASGISGQTAPVQTVTVGFSIDGGMRCSSYNSLKTNYTPCDNLSDARSGLAGGLFTGLSAVLWTGVGALATASVLATAGTFGFRRHRRQLNGEILLTILAVVCLAGAIVGYSALTPTSTESADCYFLTGEVSHCTTLWGGSFGYAVSGGCLGCKTNIGWAASSAWFEGLIAVFVTAGTAFLLWTSRSGPYTEEEEAVWRVRHRPSQQAPVSRYAPAADPASVLPPQTTWARPPTEATLQRFRISETDWICPSCLRENSRFALVCSNCHADRPAGSQ